MSTTLTPDQLDAIEARANAATPGPWEWTRPEFSPSCDCHVLLSAATTTDHGHTARIEVHSDGSAYGEYNPDIDVNGPDAAFIARTDIPALVARVRQLEADLHAARVWAGMRDNAADQADRDAEIVERRLNEEIAGLRATLAARDASDADTARVLRVLSDECERRRENAAEHQRAIVELAEEYNRRDAVTAELRLTLARLQADLARAGGAK